MKDLGATKVVVTGAFKSADDYTKAIMDATEGLIFSFNVSIKLNIFYVNKKLGLKKIYICIIKFYVYIELMRL